MLLAHFEHFNIRILQMAHEHVIMMARRHSRIWARQQVFACVEYPKHSAYATPTLLLARVRKPENVITEELRGDFKYEAALA